MNKQRHRKAKNWRRKKDSDKNNPKFGTITLPRLWLAAETDVENAAYDKTTCVTSAPPQTYI